MAHCDIDVRARHRTGCRVLSQETSHDNAFSFGLWAIDDPMCLCQRRDSESFPHTLSCHRWSQPRCGLRLHRSKFDLVWIQHVCLRPRLLRLFCSASRLCLDAELQLVTSPKGAPSVIWIEEALKCGLTVNPQQYGELSAPLSLFVINLGIAGPTGPTRARGRGDRIRPLLRRMSPKVALRDMLHRRAISVANKA
jgi:hypothetical protein